MTIVFFSWQSDINGRRNVIERALKKASKQVGEVIIDTATRDEQGAIKIDDKILEKIEKADLFVADLSLLGRLGPKKRKSPNPNVIYETGFALGVMGEEKLYLLAKKEKNGSDSSPFDLRNRNMAYYEFDSDEISKELTGDFVTWLKGLEQPPEEVYLDIYATLGWVNHAGPIGLSFINDENEPYYLERVHINGQEMPINRLIKGKDTASLEIVIHHPFESEVNDFYFIVSRRGKNYKIYQTVMNEVRADGRYNLSSLRQKIDKVELVES